MPRAKAHYSLLTRLQDSVDHAAQEGNLTYLRSLATGLERILSDVRAIAGYTGKTPPRQFINKKPDGRKPPLRFTKSAAENILKCAADAYMLGPQIRSSFGEGDQKTASRALKALAPHLSNGGEFTIYSPGEKHTIVVAARILK